MTLRQQQVRLITRFMEYLEVGESLCHQMIMGAGKTTIVGPMLALLLADGNSLITQVVPNQLLDMSRNVMRESFTAVIQKPVFTFVFERSTLISETIYMKLLKAKDSRAVVCSTPTAIKSFVLKFIEILHTLENARTLAVDSVETEKKEAKKRGRMMTMAAQGSTLAKRLVPFGGRTYQSSDIENMRKETKYATKIVELFNLGVLLLDEVDLILHPLKSELNWPLGEKKPLDLTQNRAGYGLRWNIPFVMLDAVFFYTEGRTTFDFTDSRDAVEVLDELTAVIEEGCKTKDLQKIPHIVILNRTFYTTKMRPLLSKWMVIYLRHMRIKDVSDESLLAYLMKGSSAGGDAVSEVVENLSDEHVKMLNLTHDWLISFAPFVLSKVDRVGFGLLTEDQVKHNLEQDPKMPTSRKLVAVPFVGKDVPTRASEFSHPDVVIGLTILAYRYEGMRKTDFMSKLKTLRDQMQDQHGPYNQRAANISFQEFVEQGGGRVRGTKLQADAEDDEKQAGNANALAKKKELNPEFDGIWPLHLLDLDDPEQIQLVFKMLSGLPHFIFSYLDEDIFPETMQFQELKLASNGQELGGDLLFTRRVGFSGTPSDLLPIEMGRCNYELGDQAKILHTLTDPAIMSHHTIDDDWSPSSVLTSIAQAEPPYHALIDTGAVITGFTNFEVAEYMLEVGLPTMEGCVFLDESDRKMILVRNGNKVMKLEQSGIPWGKRFTFFDQVHTTGMDIKQVLNAQAVCTLGKDMTFRDYAQGTYRMRGIGKGQTIKLFIIPEALKLLRAEVASGLGTTADERQAKLDALPETASGKQVLDDVAAWLIINGMRSEKLQFNLLCEQCTSNVWRKRAYRTLLAHADEVGRPCVFMYKRRLFNRK